MIHYGPIDPGMEIMHTCDTPACVNPAHLSQVTHKANMHDMIRKGRGPSSHKSRSARTFSDRDKESAAILYLNGRTVREIARLFDCPHQTVHKWLVALNVQMRPVGKHGDGLKAGAS
jgi:hypothetical protein